MNKRLRGMSLLAAAGVAAAGIVATAPSAHAAGMTDALCAGATPTTTGAPACTIITSPAQVVEGTKVTAKLQGNKNAQLKVKVFSIAEDGTLTAAGPEVAVTTSATGYADVDAPVDVLKAPMVGGRHFVVQPADATKATVMGTSGKPFLFEVYSHRGAVRPTNLSNLTPGSTPYVAVESGRAGDEYLVQVFYDNKWNTWTMPGEGKITRDGQLATSMFKVQALPRGDYKFRVLNNTTGDVVAESTYRVGDGQAAPAPAPTNAPKQGTGGLAKTGF